MSAINWGSRVLLCVIVISVAFLCYRYFRYSGSAVFPRETVEVRDIRKSIDTVETERNDGTGAKQATTSKKADVISVETTDGPPAVADRSDVVVPFYASQVNRSSSVASSTSTEPLPIGNNVASTSPSSSFSSGSSICPKCEKRVCVTTQKEGKCPSLMENIKQQFRHWAPGSVKASQIRAAHSTHGKCFTVYWNGVDRIQTFFHNLADQPQWFLPRKVGYLVIVDLLHQVLSTAKLPAFEFVICPMDRAPSGNKNPLFTIAKGNQHKVSLFPNIFGTFKRRNTFKFKRNADSKEAISCCFPLTNYSLPWKSKSETLFYRGSCVSLRSWGKKATDVCIGHKKGEKLTFKADLGLIGDPKSWKGQCRALTEQCHGDFVTYAKSAENKYLDILQGNGYTGRYKEFLAFNSLNFKRYDFHLYEFFEFGMLSGPGGHVIEGIDMTLQEFHRAVQWAQLHDSDAEKMARNAEKHIRWAFADKTILCVVFHLMQNYVKILGYDPAKEPSQGFFNAKDTGRDAMKAMILEEGQKLHNDKQLLYTAKMEKLPTNEQHEQFVKMCEPVLEYPESEP